MRNHLSLIILILLLSLLACSNSDSDIEYSDATIETIQVEKVWELNGGSLPIEQSFFKVGDLEVDSKGNIYVADFSDRRIKKFSPEGEFIITIGRPGQGPGEFGGTFFMELDARDNLFVVDGVNGRIQKFSSDGEYIKSIGARFLGGFNDFEISGEKIFFRNQARSNEMLVESDTSLYSLKRVVPTPKEIRKDFRNTSFSLASFTILPNSNFLFFNSITEKFYEITDEGILIQKFPIKYRELSELIRHNDKIRIEQKRTRTTKSGIEVIGSARIPVFSNLNTFGDKIYTMYNEVNKFGNSLESIYYLYQIDMDGNFLKKFTGFEDTKNFFTIDKQGNIYAMDWFLSKVCKYQIPGSM